MVVYKFFKVEERKMKTFKFIFGIIGTIVFMTMVVTCGNPVDNGISNTSTEKGDTASVTINAPGVSSTLKSAMASSSSLNERISRIVAYETVVSDTEGNIVYDEVKPVSAFPLSIDKLTIGEMAFVITALDVKNVILAKGYVTVILVAGSNNIKVTLEWEPDSYADADVIIEIGFAPIVQIYNAGFSYAPGNLETSYWVNGARKSITPANRLIPEAITVSNSKVYVAGSGFWWNSSGIIHELSFPPNNTRYSYAVSAKAITVSNDNVYMAGYNWEPVEMSHVTGSYFDDKPRACFWINETIFNFSDNILPSEAMAITVSEDKIYTAGYIPNNGFPYRACYWIDTGIAQILQIPEGKCYSMPNAITVFGSKVYTAGSYGFQSYDEQACYWVNTEINILQVPSGTVWSQANAIIVVDDKVYVSGFYVEGDWAGFEWTRKACYWDDNGIFYDLHPNNANSSYSNFITESNGYVYIAGIYNESYKHDHVVYWKNGKMYDLGLMDDGFRYELLQSYLVLLE
jgi:hypothetical protein